ncbi:MAG: UDP-N-acetylmuramoyl-L-alanyl-D-glutamate--2,6-diaminopimelate ligase [Candidatus Sumerlaeaceae bacterium]|nr:UDP-N-acetylmuramoyl-L-alanyl-D-glutamate--2,6-diaminopimelate ligase [Candidatus Sumerlaeaceae bacterium]
MKSILLGDLFARAGLAPPSQGADLAITGITDNSRKTEPGNIFVAVQGTVADGHAFISDAVERGASVVVVEKDIPDYRNAVVVHVSRSADALGRLAHAFHGNPSAGMKVFGVTGTNGKTTTAYLLESILREAGYNPGVIGTIEYRYAGRKLKAGNTTPSAMQLAQLFAEMRDAGVNAVAMEASSHAIDQARISGIEFDVCVFTNLTQDHLDYHKTMEDYAAAKRNLFTDYLLRPHTPGKSAVPGASFNNDDPWGREFAAAFSANKLAWGMEPGADLLAQDIQFDARGTRFHIAHAGQQHTIQTNLLCLFNVQNILGACGAALLAGMDWPTIRRGIDKLPIVPGRFEPVHAGQDFLVVVDYAHTPDALERVLLNARTMTSSRIITVFGCGGDRDNTKRPKMGAIAGNLSNHVILTNDNPRTEDPASIAAMALDGIKASSIAPEQVEVVLDRRDAIGRAIALASTGDCVVIAGKGHEDYQEIGKERFHFDDREVAAEMIRDTLAGKAGKQ